MTDEPQTWPPPPNVPIEDLPWDDFIAEKLAHLPVDGLRHSRIMIALRVEKRFAIGDCRKIVTSYYARHGIVDPPYKMTWQVRAVLIYIVLYVVVVALNLAIHSATPHGRSAILEHDKERVLIDLAQIAVLIPIGVRAVAVLRKGLRARRA